MQVTKYIRIFFKVTESFKIYLLNNFYFTFTQKSKKGIRNLSKFLMNKNFKKK